MPKIELCMPDALHINCDKYVVKYVGLYQSYDWICDDSISEVLIGLLISKIYIFGSFCETMLFQSKEVKLMEM